MAHELSGKVAVVTGGSSGIGLGVAERFVAEGARVVVADVDRERGEEVAGALGPDATFHRADVAVPAEVVGLVRYAVETLGGLDVMVNNAGISGTRHTTLFDDDFADFEQVMAVNLLGVMTGTREAGRHMAAAGGGSIVNVASIGGIQPAPSLWTYHASKAAVVMFSKSAAIDLGGHAVRVNCIAPGNIETPILERTVAAGLPEEERAEAMRRVRSYIISRQPLQRQGATADVAEAALWFACDRSVYVTGTVLPVDGGLLAGNPSRPSELSRPSPP